MPAEPSKPSLWALAGLFLRIACASFGGYMTMISLVQDAVVARRKWLSSQDVLDGLSLASILPGPLAINVVAYVGYRLRGVAGAAVCVCAAVLPAFGLMVGLATLYFRWGHLPQLDRVFVGVTPAVAAVVLAAGWKMWRSTVTGWREALLAGVAAAALMLVSSVMASLAVIVGSALLGRLWFHQQALAEGPQGDPGAGVAATQGAGNSMAGAQNPLVDGAPFAASAGPAAGAAVCCAPPAATTVSQPLPASLRARALPPASPLGIGALLAAPLALLAFLAGSTSVAVKLLAAFAGMSLLMFGGGYVSIPLLQQATVHTYGWVSQREFIDAMALAQVTPGPVMISAAFVGFKAGGLAGAAAATAGMFAPTAILLIACAHGLQRLKRSAAVQAGLRGVRAAMTGMVVAAAFTIGKSAAVVWLSPVLFLLALALLLRWRIEAVWVVPVCGLLSYLLL